MQEGGSPLYESPPGDSCASFCHKENLPPKKEEDGLYTYATTAPGVGVKNCPGPPRPYEIPLSLNSEKNQEFRKYSTLKH